MGRALSQGRTGKANRRSTGPSEYVPGYLFYGPEQPTHPGGIGPYTRDSISFHGYTLRKENRWSNILERWNCCETAINVLGPGPGAPPMAGNCWLARVANVTAEGSTRLEALEEAWAAAEYEDALRHLLPPEPYLVNAL